VPLPYRRGVGIVLVNRTGKVFVAERIDTPNAWQMPQGGIDGRERPRTAAMRELKEEIGTSKARIVATSKGWLRYDLPPALAGKAWKGKYRGQEQKWFVMLFTGRDSDIDLATAHPEFARWKWIAFRRLPSLIVGFKRALYEQVVAEFADIIAKLGTAKTDDLRRTRAVKKPTRPRARAAGRGRAVR
jgi:putative (di)nucleoside polyphosphate hydrolase